MLQVLTQWKLIPGCVHEFGEGRGYPSGQAEIREAHRAQAKFSEVRLAVGRNQKHFVSSKQPTEKFTFSGIGTQTSLDRRLLVHLGTERDNALYYWCTLVLQECGSRRSPVDGPRAAAMLASLCRP